MRYKKQLYTLIITLLGAVMSISCNAKDANTTPADTPVADTEAMANIDTMDITTLFECEVEDNNVIITFPESETEPKAAPAPEKKKNIDKPSRGRKETLYISTYAANGKVWGHVTMNGNTGRGTIHDDEENSYSITVTRHGGELHGTDQNGRLYVFKI